MGTNRILHLEQVRVQYGSFVAVDGLDLDVAAGEVLGLLGPNGAGKSSTLRVLTGQLRPGGGRVTVAGLDLVRDWQCVKPLVGYVPDRDNHFEEFSGRYNLEFYAGLYKVTRARVDECLDLVGLREEAHVPVRAYSLGMRRKLLLARSLLHRPRLLYLDEPGANLDVPSTAMVHRLLRDLAAGGATVILASHNMKEVEDLCDRVAILNRGQLVALDSPRNLCPRRQTPQVDAVLRDGSRLVFDLGQPADQVRLSRHIAAGEVARLQTRPTGFHEAFLELTAHVLDGSGLPA